MKKQLIIDLGDFDLAPGRNRSKLIAGEEALLYRQMIEQKKLRLSFLEATVGHRQKERENIGENIKKQFADSTYSAHHISKIMARKRFLGRPRKAISDRLFVLLTSSVLSVLYWISGKKREYYCHYLNALKNITSIKLWISST